MAGPGRDRSCGRPATCQADPRARAGRVRRAPDRCHRRAAPGRRRVGWVDPVTRLIGVDLGTTGAKAVLADADGEILATSWIEYPMLRPHPAWAENDPEDWVRGVQWLVSQLIASSRVDPGSVVAISIVAQRDPVVLIDGVGEVLTT